MGLFGMLTDGKRKKPASRKALAVPDGDSTVKVFTYDGRPLGKIRAGKKFKLTLHNAECCLESIYTGTLMDGQFVLTYEGKPIGFLGSGRDVGALMNATERHDALLLHATVTGWASGGWPEIAVHFDREWLKNSSEK
jgi:hypothetical protein